MVIACLEALGPTIRAGMSLSQNIRSFASAAVVRQLSTSLMSEVFQPRSASITGANSKSGKMLKWGADRNVILHFIDSGKPNKKARIESLNVFERIPKHNFFQDVDPRSGVGGLCSHGVAHSFLGFSQCRAARTPFAEQNGTNVNAHFAGRLLNRHAGL